VTLTRHQAKVLYDLALAAGFEEAHQIVEQKEVIANLVAAMDDGSVHIALSYV